MKQIQKLIALGADEASVKHIGSFYLTLPFNNKLVAMSARAASDGGGNIYSGDRFNSAIEIYRSRFNVSTDEMSDLAVIAEIAKMFHTQMAKADTRASLGLNPLEQAQQMVGKFRKGNNYSEALTSLTEAELKAAQLDNVAQMKRLGLISGDTDSVINALQKIVASDTSSDNHRLIAQLILEDPTIISNSNFVIGHFGEDVGFAGMENMFCLRNTSTRR